jgi:hypothetical protein
MKHEERPTAIFDGMAFLHSPTFMIMKAKSKDATTA